jgi:hypothetical protein
MTDSDGFRGVVLGSSWRFQRNNWLVSGQGFREVKGYQGQRGATDELLRRSLFYFDKVVWPTNNVLPQGVDQGVDFLVAEGEVERIHKEFAPTYPGQIEMLQGGSNAFTNKWFVNAGTPNGSIAEAVGLFHRSVYAQLETIQKGQWVFAEVGEGVDLESEKTTRGYAMELYNVLPVPQKLASYEDIIAFKKRERTALLDMRIALGDLYIQIASCEDKDFTANLNTEKVKRSIATVQELLNKSRLPWVPQSLEVDLNVFSAIAAVLTAEDAYTHLEKWGVSTPSAVVGGVLLAVGLSIKRKTIPVLSPESSLYAYIGTPLRLRRMK